MIQAVWFHELIKRADHKHQAVVEELQGLYWGAPSQSLTACMTLSKILSHFGSQFSCRKNEPLLDQTLDQYVWDFLLGFTLSAKFCLLKPNYRKNPTKSVPCYSTSKSPIVNIWSSSSPVWCLNPWPVFSDNQYEVSLTRLLLPLSTSQ